MHSFQAHGERTYSAVLDRPSTMDALIPHLMCNWPRVVIHDVAVGRPAGRGERRVTARIHLGALLPGDVQVALVADRAPSAAPGGILLSRRTEPDEDGSHLFEAIVPSAVLDGGSCAVRVTPAADLPAWRYILEAVEAPCECRRAVEALP